MKIYSGFQIFEKAYLKHITFLTCSATTPSAMPFDTPCFLCPLAYKINTFTKKVKPITTTDNPEFKGYLFLNFTNQEIFKCLLSTNRINGSRDFFLKYIDFLS